MGVGGSAALCTELVCCTGELTARLPPAPTSLCDPGLVPCLGYCRSKPRERCTRAFPPRGARRLRGGVDMDAHLLVMTGQNCSRGSSALTVLLPPTEALSPRNPGSRTWKYTRVWRAGRHRHNTAAYTTADAFPSCSTLLCEMGTKKKIILKCCVSILCHDHISLTQVYSSGPDQEKENRVIWAEMVQSNNQQLFNRRLD